MSVEKRIKDLIMENLGVSEDEVKPEAHFIDDLRADSLDTVELLLAIEKEFDIDNIPDEVAEKMTTVQSAIDLVNQIQKEKGLEG